MKALVWDGDWFLLLCKRLENGHYRRPRTECEAKQLTSQQLRWRMEGLEIEKKSNQTGPKKMFVLSSYNRLIQAKRCSCFFHVRRKFVKHYHLTKNCGQHLRLKKASDAVTQYSPLNENLTVITRTGEPLSPEDKHHHRSEEVRPFPDGFFNWLVTVNPACGSKLAKAVQ